MNPYAYQELGEIADFATTSERAGFLVQTYLHLAGAVVASVGIIALLFQLPTSTQEGLIGSMVMGYNWLIVLGLYWVVSWLANRWALSATSKATQYAGLAIYTVVISIILFVGVWVAAHFGGTTVLPTAIVMTLGLFAGLTGIVFYTKEDFSYLRGILFIGMLAAAGLIVCGIVFGFNLGMAFTVAMIALMCGCVLYDTSNVLHHYRIGQHVAASLALFASLSVLFWYVLQMVMALSSD